MEESHFYLVFPLLAVFYLGGHTPTVQKYISIANTYIGIVGYFLYCYFPVIRPFLYHLIFDISASYFLYDLIVIILHNRKDWPYIFHHLGTLYMYINHHLINNNELLFVTYFYIELSNSFLTLYSLYRTTQIKSYLVTFYVPYRLVTVPYCAYRLSQSANYSTHIVIPCIALTLMSVIYALKLSRHRINYYSLFTIYIDIALLTQIVPTLSSTHQLIFFPYILYNFLRVINTTLHRPRFLHT